jgi:hypothetical protein
MQKAAFGPPSFFPEAPYTRWPQRSASLRILAFLLAIAAIAAVPFLLLALAFHFIEFSFEGGGVREWLFVRGSVADKLGLAAPQGRVWYRVRGQDGNAPASTEVLYHSTLAPTDVIEAFAAACVRHGYKVESRTPLVPPSSPDERYVKCDGKSEAWVTAEPIPGGSRVNVVAFEPL